jgi:hypothetical protein
MIAEPDAPLFLSAGVPNKDPHLYRPDPIAIREAVRALVAIVVPEHFLVFGGHPAITPLVWDAAHSLQAHESVYIYQSELYRPFVPQQVRFFPNVVWTPIRPGASVSNPRDVEDSLQTMREWMIQKRLFPTTRTLKPYCAGVFIGGMKGIEIEWDMFTHSYPNAPAFPVASTEGEARNLWSRVAPPQAVNRKDWPRLDSELNYRRLFRSLLT